MKKFAVILLTGMLLVIRISSAFAFGRWDYYDDEYEKMRQQGYKEALSDTYQDCLRHSSVYDCEIYNPKNFWDYTNNAKITWKCVDATSYDGNAFNDNKCTSSKGQVKYVSDSQAKILCPSYSPGKSGAGYYNRK